MPEKPPPLGACVAHSLDNYFSELGDTDSQNLHAMVIAEVENHSWKRSCSVPREISCEPPGCWALIAIR